MTSIIRVSKFKKEINIHINISIDSVNKTSTFKNITSPINNNKGIN